MTTDTVLIERALWVMAIAMSLQALLFLGAAIGAIVAWGRAARAVDEAQLTMKAQMALMHAHIDRLDGHVDRITGTVAEVGRSVRRGTEAAGDVVTEVREVVGTVGNSLQSVASVVAAPRTAMAIGLLRGVAMWRRRRASHRRPPTLAAADVQLSES